jgi:hypothetical protein
MRKEAGIAMHSPPSKYVVIFEGGGGGGGGGEVFSVMTSKFEL